MKRNTKILFSSLLASAMVIGAAGCEDVQTSDGSYDDDDYNNNKPPAPPQIEGCTEWEWDGDQWVCEKGSLLDDNDADFIYFYNGTTHTTSIRNTPGFNSSSKSKVTSGSKSSSSVKSGGFGSGTKGGSSTGG